MSPRKLLIFILKNCIYRIKIPKNVFIEFWKKLHCLAPHTRKRASDACAGWEKGPMHASVAVLAEIPLRSPHKLFIFIIKQIICWFKVSKNKIIYFWRKLHWCTPPSQACLFLQVTICWRTCRLAGIALSTQHSELFTPVKQMDYDSRTLSEHTKQTIRYSLLYTLVLLSTQLLNVLHHIGIGRHCGYHIAVNRDCSVTQTPR